MSLYYNIDVTSSFRVSAMLTWIINNISGMGRVMKQHEKFNHNYRTQNNFTEVRK